MNVSRILQSVGAVPADWLGSLARTASVRSITDFMTDGSLAAVCSELALLTGVSVELRDPQGRRIVRSGDSIPWRVDDAPSETPGWSSVPLRAAGLHLGDIWIAPGKPHGSDRASLLRTVELLSSTTTELCEHELELRERVKEVGALYKLSSLLVRATDVPRVLNTALDLCISTLGVDAGSIRLFRDDAEGPFDPNEYDMELKAARGLSREFLDHPIPLSKDRIFDKLALNGEIVAIEDVRTDPRVQILDIIEQESMRGFLCAGLVFQSKPIGIVRLYSSTPRRFAESDKRLLRSIASQAAVAVEQARLLRFEEQEQLIQRQVSLAADVQRRMLPRGTPDMPGFDVAAKYIPSFDLGGDFYDFIDLNGHFGIAVGDVVGKGVAAALLMAAVRASLRAHSQQVYDLDEVVARVNQALCRDTRDNEFASLWYGVIDPATLRLTYCSAGHEPTIIIRNPKHRKPTAADIDELSIGGMVVGIDPSQRYQRAVCDLKPRDVLVAITDGVTDANDFQNKRFGRARVRDAILRILGKEPDASASRILEHLHWEIRQFAGLSTRPDDSTTVVVRVKDR
jgi:phosphoserine phosphatase RsbU/P